MVKFLQACAELRWVIIPEVVVVLGRIYILDDDSSSLLLPI